MDVCPKCAYVRQPRDGDPYLECPRCGIVFAKYVKHHQAIVASTATEEAAPVVEAAVPPLTLGQRLADRLMELPERPNEAVLLAQAAVLLVMVVWGVRLIACKLIPAAS